MAPAEIAQFESKPPAAKVPVCMPGEAYGGLTAVLRKIQKARKRRLFALIADPIADDTCSDVYVWSRDMPEEFDILIHSPGGDLGACYRMARIFCRRATSWEALVPSCAASGATLICLGSSNIVMAGIAQLGPIDPQVISKRSEKFLATERQSPLEAFQALTYLRQFALTSMDTGMKFLLGRRVAPKPALEMASSMATHLAQPILNKIDPYDLGAFALDSTLSINYCERVGNPVNQAKKTQRNVPYRDLVEKYPVHEFIIDIEEAKALAFTVSEPTDELDGLFNELRPLLDGVERYIGFVDDEEVRS
jgi:hypothetical protein